MIYDQPGIGEPLDQGDLFDACPILTMSAFHAETGSPEKVDFGNRRTIILTQTCDFANSKVTAADFSRLHTMRFDLLALLCKNGHRRARVRPLYREHLAKHFADTFSRIGLPKPYETM